METILIVNNNNDFILPTKGARHLYYSIITLIYTLVIHLT